MCYVVSIKDLATFHSNKCFISCLGRCGAVAIIKEYIDDKNGLMELRTTEGGHGSVILFNENQVWVTDR